MAQLKIYFVDCFDKNCKSKSYNSLYVLTIRSKDINNIYNAIDNSELGKYNYKKLFLKKSHNNYKLPFTRCYPYAYLYSIKENELKIEVHTFVGLDFMAELIFEDCKITGEYIDIDNIDLSKKYLKNLTFYKDKNKK